MTAFNNNNEVERYRRFLLRQQEGRGIPWENGEMIYQGRRAQRGFGFFGDFFGSVGKAALPLVKKVGKQVLGQALAVGKDVLLEGKSPREALKERGKELLTKGLKGGLLFKDKYLAEKQARKRKRQPTLDEGQLWQPRRKAKSRRM